MDPHVPGSLEEQVATLRDRVLRLERMLQAYGIVEEPEQPAPAEPASAIPIEKQSPAAPPPSPSSPGRPIEPPRFAVTDAAVERDAQSMESRIGSQWFNRIGILAILIGMAWFVKLAIDNHWIGPLGRVLIGLVAGAGLIGMVRAFPLEGLHDVCLLAQSHGQRHPLHLALGCLLALPPGSGICRLCGHDRGDGVQRISGLGAGRRTCWPSTPSSAASARRCWFPPAKTTKSPCSATC